MGLVEIVNGVRLKEESEKSLVIELSLEAVKKMNSLSYRLFIDAEYFDVCRSKVSEELSEKIALTNLTRIISFASSLQLISTALINGKEINVRLSEIPVSYDFINEVWPGFAPGRVRIFNNPNEIDFLAKLIYRDESEDNLRKNIKVSLQSERGITLKMSTDLDSSDTI